VERQPTAPPSGLSDNRVGPPSLRDTLVSVSIPYYHIDSFADELFAGNPAGVCFVPAFPAKEVMQKIAAENRHSETAFVVARPDGDFDLRWFTPVVEDDLCGHATLASAYALSLRGHDTWPVRFYTVSGLLTVDRDRERHDTDRRDQERRDLKRHNHARFEMDFPARPPASCEVPAGLLSTLGLKSAEVLRDPRDFLVVVNHAGIVRDLKPDIAALAKIDMGVGGGAIVTAAGENDVDYVCRFFAPSEGIDEDPATGSIHCSLVPYWAGRTGKQTFRVRQLSPRGAQMWCALLGPRVKIAGETKLYLQGTINI
jgi:predicted PhzF superfamily epimerase YddE/YHI9